ncbi:Tetratricopeptide-like helical domain superfamily, partial [Sesbania bispinosa]
MWVQRRENWREERIGRCSSLLRNVGSEKRELEGAVVCKVGEVISAIKNAKRRFSQHSWKFSQMKNEMAGGMHFHEAVKIKSSLPGAYLNLGNVYKGFLKKLLHAINILFRHGQTMYGYGVLSIDRLGLKGFFGVVNKNEMAGGMHFHEAVKMKSSFPGAYLNLGNMYKALGIPQEATARYQHALQTWPYYGMAHGFRDSSRSYCMLSTSSLDMAKL